MRTLRIPWALAAALLASCASYGAPDNVLYGEAVYTQPSPGFDFRVVNTYFLDTSINMVDDDPLLIPTVAMPANIASAIDANMAALGYTPAPKATANVQLKAAVLKGTGAVYYPGYWCDYYYYYSCYYSWSYAGTYQYGSMVLEMGDLSSPLGGPIKILWSAMVYGVATSQPFDNQRVASGIDRAFSQSPYLDTH